MAIFSWFRNILNGTATVFFRCVLRCFRLVFFMVPPRKQINSSTPSSSSSSDSTPSCSSSSESWKHDVFLSFRGTDTRNNFVDHLYYALDEQGIYTFKDDTTLPRGETIGPSLLKAIEESHIAVIVFSENYADSSWCLQELAHIMKCKDERGLIVMPIFYNIDPSELRKQKGKYGKALAKHESDKKNVESWRKALADAGNLSGDVVNGPEKKFIKQFVDMISNRLPAPISSENDDLVGIKARLQHLKSKMEMVSDRVVVVGIWGLGGGGKTTLASALYDEISTNFDGSCFIKDVREESSKHGLEKLQEKVLSLVLKQEVVKVNRVDEGRHLIKSRLFRKKVLIVLDDIGHLDQVKALAGSHDWFRDGSQIIITTRDKNLLDSRIVNVVYDVCLLREDEAIKLFHKHAPRHGIPVEDYEMLSKEVVSYAGGLPLALKVLGSFLRDKDMSEWKSALARLKEIPDSEIIEKLKISYDGLKPLEKELFLDIACFFRRRFNRDEAMMILDACGFYPIIGVKVLIQKALITVSYASFDMHDLIQEMAHYIVRGENPEKHSRRIWRTEDVQNIIDMDSMTENDRIEALKLEWFPGEHSSSLQQVVANMKELRWMSCGKCPSTSFPKQFEPTKLCYLRLRSSPLEQLWEGNKLLPKLKVLDLSFSKDLVRTPDLTGLPCLERMVLRCCKSLTEIHPSIGSHEKLILLDMDECKRLEIFPPITGMKKLETLILSSCRQLHKFPEIQTSMDNLVELNLRESGIEALPSSIGQYCTNLVSFDLRSCYRLQSIEGNFHCLKHLKEFHLDCGDKIKIPEEGLFDVDCCLQMLCLYDTSFKKFHQVIGFSRSLVRLKLSCYYSVGGDISSVPWDEFSNLQALELSGNHFSRLDSSLSQLSRLKYLRFSRCNSLVELPDLPSSLAILLVRSCQSLEIVDLPTNLKWLWKLDVVAENATWVDGKKVVQSMLQGNAVEDYVLYLDFDGTLMSTKRKTFMLELPPNWYNEFSGFLIYTTSGDEFAIEDGMGKEDEDDVLKVPNDEDEVFLVVNTMRYISFGALRHTTWWNSTHTKISCSIEHGYLKVELVPRRSKGERPKDAINLSEFWDQEGKGGTRTFKITHDSKSSIKFGWSSACDLFSKRNYVL
ncbi:hypothetical protein OSB04_018693 [Centaurea solstitialis]|uniref:ADP-ribosyl cyclase/cyclic ADP-ribose hydrolase n=1 Tax=Centaurea solstitialis TaxID=347529 RepID=A0AA38TQ76_9ASTR|nr:hypothetical protein OSB04_018693 [Centaurea solstitialis]